MATKAAADPAGGLKVTLDFTGLSDRERSTHFQASDILFKIVGFRPRIKKGDERKPTAQQTRFMEMQVVAVRTPYGGDVGGYLYENLMTFIPGKEPREYLWKVRNLLKAVAKEGAALPTSRADIDFATLIDRTFMGTVIDGDDWESTNEETGKTTTYKTSQINAFHKASLYEEAYGTSAQAPSTIASKQSVESGTATEVAADEAGETEDDDDDSDLPALEVADL